MAKGRTFAIGCAAIAGLGTLMIGACAGLIYFGFQSAGSTVSPKIDAIFSAIENGTFADTYETETASALRAVTTKEQYTALGEMIASRLGKLQSKSLRGFHMRQTNGDAYIETSYNATFENGEGTIVARLKKENNDWKFLSFSVNSPLFEQHKASATCSSCGKPYQANARFCPSCGTSVESDVEEQRPEAETEGSGTELGNGRQSISERNDSESDK